MTSLPLSVVCRHILPQSPSLFVPWDNGRKLHAFIGVDAPAANVFSEQCVVEAMVRASVRFYASTSWVDQEEYVESVIACGYALTWQPDDVVIHLLREKSMEDFMTACALYRATRRLTCIDVFEAIRENEITSGAFVKPAVDAIHHLCTNGQVAKVLTMLEDWPVRWPIPRIKCLSAETTDLTSLFRDEFRSNRAFGLSRIICQANSRDTLHPANHAMLIEKFVANAIVVMSILLSEDDPSYKRACVRWCLEHNALTYIPHWCNESVKSLDLFALVMGKDRIIRKVVTYGRFKQWRVGNRRFALAIRRHCPEHIRRHSPSLLDNVNYLTLATLCGFTEWIETIALQCSVAMIGETVLKMIDAPRGVRCVPSVIQCVRLLAQRLHSDSLSVPDLVRLLKMTGPIENLNLVYGYHVTVALNHDMSISGLRTLIDACDVNHLGATLCDTRDIELSCEHIDRLSKASNPQVWRRIVDPVLYNLFIGQGIDTLHDVNLIDHVAQSASKLHECLSLRAACIGGHTVVALRMLDVFQARQDVDKIQKVCAYAAAASASGIHGHTEIVLACLPVVVDALSSPSCEPEDTRSICLVLNTPWLFVRVV